MWESTCKPNEHSEVVEMGNSLMMLACMYIYRGTVFNMVVMMPACMYIEVLYLMGWWCTIVYVTCGKD